MPLKCVIIDNQQYAVDALSGYIDRMSVLTLHSTYTDPLLALSEIDSAMQIDFIFMDIEMPGISGIDLAKSLRPMTRFLVFSTNHPHYAVEAFEVRASQFLLKPYTFSHFALKVQDLINSRQFGTDIPTKSSSTTHRFIKGEGKNSFISIDTADISHLKADRNYVEIYTRDKNGPQVLRLGINQAQAQLGSHDFIRINKSILAAKQQIARIEGNTVTMSNGTKFFIGPSYRRTFIEFLEHRLLR
ncbi:LytR/AlgR family response regulator transcription factor [Pedobacter sp. WC2501]|uniref:LytR/AlgR family response regulator transcription factor n=1 Tax=Pedobacter sp. WC2501 TaxID=3461400 RepID=UPI0040457212